MNIVDQKELTEIEIQNLIKKILSGDINAFELLYDNYYKMVASIIRRIIKPSITEVDSLINEAFLIVYKGLKGFKGNSKFSTYAYRIVLNYAFKMSKRKSREKKHFVIFDNNDDTVENISSTELMEEQIIARNTLEQVIGTLNREHQEAIDLYYYGDYSIKEIAEIVGTTDTAIKNRLFQARMKIKQELIRGNHNEKR